MAESGRNQALGAPESAGLMWIHIAAIGLVLLHLVLRALRLWLLLPDGRRPRFWLLVVANSYGDLGASVTPARLGGDPARVVALRRTGVEMASGIVAIGAERILEWIALTALSAVFIITMGGDIVQGGRDVWSRVATTRALPWLGLFGILIVAGFAGMHWYRKRHPAKLNDSIARAWSSARALSPRLVAAAMLATIGIVATRVAILPILLAAFIHDFSVASILLGSFVLTYGQLLLPTPSGVGPVELAFVAGFGQSLSAPDLTILLVTWRFYTVAMGALLGVFFFLRSVVTKRGLANIAVLCLAIGITPMAVRAQERPAGSRYLPMGHWAYEYVQRLRTRGLLASLNPLVQPYDRMEIASDLTKLDPDTLRAPLARWVRLLQDEFAFELDRIEGRGGRAWGVRLAGGVRASSSQRLDPTRPLGDGDAWPRYNAGAWVEAGPFAGETRLLGDAYLNDDPEGLDPQTRQGGRTDNAYVTVSIPHVRVSVGKFQRNWSALGTEGLLISDEPYAYPQIGLDVRVGRFSLRSFTGELDTFADQKRFVAGHRLDYEVGDLVIAFGESILYAGGSGFSLRFLNPVEFLFFERDERPGDVKQNLVLTGQVWYQRSGVALFAEAMVDDFDISPGSRDREPTLYGFTLGSRVTSVAPWLELDLMYERVSAWAYRTPNGFDEYSFLRRGLGANFSDFDRVTLAANLFPPVSHIRLTPLVRLQRQGEGDLRDSVPPLDEYLGSRTLFLGVKESTFRLALQGRFQPNQYVWLSWDVGENVVTNAGHVQDANESEFSAVVAAGISINLPLRRPR